MKMNQVASDDSNVGKFNNRNSKADKKRLFFSCGDSMVR